MANLYVNGLPDGMDENGFRQLFEAHGVVASVKFVPERKYGFVKFVDGNVAERVLNTMQGYQIDGASLNLRWANTDVSGKGGGDFGGKGAGGPEGGWGDGSGSNSTPSDNLYIKGLPPNMAEEDIRKVFGPYGAIASCRILQACAVNTDPAGETIIMMRMGELVQARWLVDNLHGNIPQGLTKPIMVKYAQERSFKGKGFDGGKGSGSWGGGSDAGFGGGWGGGKAGGGWGDRYEPYGGGKGGKGKGKEGWGKGFEGKGDWGQYGQHSKMMVETLVGIGRVPCQKLLDGSDPTDLYVKGLPPDASELYLYKVFSPFGAIESAHAMVNWDGSLSGVGFVKFHRPEDAELAARTVSASKLPDGYHLLVQQKRPKGTQDSWSGGGNSWGGDGQQQLSLLGPSGDGSLSSQIAAHAPQNMGAPPHMQPGSGGGGW